MRFYKIKFKKDKKHKVYMIGCGFLIENRLYSRNTNK